MSKVTITHLTKTYKKQAQPAVDDFDLELASGELVVLLGPSGCGKTTLLRSIAGLERPDGGRIEFNDVPVFDSITGKKEVPTHKRDIGMVFQNYALWPHLTVAQNVAYPMKSRHYSRADIKKKVVDTLALVECEAYVDRYPADLSGGQQQRIALARAMGAAPAVLLFDEPLSNLDFRLRAQLRQDIRNLHRSAGFTGLYVTHDQTEALQIGDRVVVMRLGKREQVGKPIEVFSRPASPYVARFLGISNTAHLRYSAGKTGWEALDAPDGNAMNLEPREQGAYELYVRSSDVELTTRAEASALGGERASIGVGTVRDVVYSGEYSEWIVDLGFATWSAVAPARTFAFKVGDRVGVTFNRATALLYAADASAALLPEEEVQLSS